MWIHLVAPPFPTGDHKGLYWRMREILQIQRAKYARPSPEGGRKGTPLLYTNAPGRRDTRGEYPHADMLREVITVRHSTRCFIRQLSLKAHPTTLHPARPYGIFRD